jgi:putative ABC transport system permease protein
MTPLQLALRSLLLARPRTLAALVFVAGCLGALDLFAGYLDGVLRQAEYQAVIALHGSGMSVQVVSGSELSSRYESVRWESSLALSLAAGATAVAIAAVIAATASINAIERRREFATLRALGMTATGLFAHIAAEALALVLCATALGMSASGLIACGMNRIAVRAGGQLAIELDPRRLLVAMAAVLAVTLLAAGIPALKAARANVPLGLAGAEPGAS